MHLILTRLQERSVICFPLAERASERQRADVGIVCVKTYDDLPLEAGTQNELTIRFAELLDLRSKSREATVCNLERERDGEKDRMCECVCVRACVCFGACVCV